MVMIFKDDLSFYCMLIALYQIIVKNADNDVRCISLQSTMVVNFKE